MAAVVMSMVSCTASISGEAVQSSVVLSPGPADDFPPEDRGGFGSGPIDQPSPVRGERWPGWVGQPQGSCSWIAPGLFDEVAAQAPVNLSPFCSFKTKENNFIQIHWESTYQPFHFNYLAFFEKTSVAGAEARFFDLASHQGVNPGSCQIQPDTRSFSHPTVLQWNPEKKLDRAKSCATVKRVMELLLRSVVPLAGGTVRPGPQTPAPEVLGKLTACEVVGDVTMVAAGIQPGKGTYESGEHPLGTTCRADRPRSTAETLLTTGPGQGLAEVKPAPAARVTPIPLGMLRARMEVLGPTCAVAVELVPGRLLRTQYSHVENHRGSCQHARLIAADAVERLIERSR